MWYCLVERVGNILETPEALLQIIPDMRAAFLEFRRRNGFAPNPEQLVRIVLGLEGSLKRRRVGARLDEDLGMADTEGLAPVALVHMLCRLRQEQRTELSDDNFLKANVLKAKILRTKTKLEDHAKELCTICYVEKPTAQFRHAGVEQWYGTMFLPICGCCGKRKLATTIATEQEHVDITIKSLQLRVYTLLKMAEFHLPDVTKGQMKRWNEIMKKMHIPLGHGKGVRWEDSAKRLDRKILGSLLAMACERLLFEFEPELQGHYSALRFALQLVNLR